MLVAAAASASSKVVEEMELRPWLLHTFQPRHVYTPEPEDGFTCFESLLTGCVGRGERDWRFGLDRQGLDLKTFWRLGRLEALLEAVQSNTQGLFREGILLDSMQCLSSRWSLYFIPFLRNTTPVLSHPHNLNIRSAIDWPMNLTIDDQVHTWAR